MPPTRPRPPRHGRRVRLHRRRHPHVWTLRVEGAGGRYRLPVFVRPARRRRGGRRSRRRGAAEGHRRPAWHARRLGHRDRRRRCLHQCVYVRLAAAGYKLIVYGSQAAVMGNQARRPVLGADWTDVPHLHSGDQMTQYVSYAAYDESLAAPTLPFWTPAPHETEGNSMEISKTPPGTGRALSLCSQGNDGNIGRPRPPTARPGTCR